MKDLVRQLRKIEKRINKGVSGPVSFAELFNKDFMAKYTDFSSIEELFDYCKVDIKTEEDHDKLLNGAIDEYTKEKTKFDSWKEMYEKAAEEEMVRRLNKMGIKTK